MNLFVEVTHTDQSDLNTGIQRVVRNVLRQLLEIGTQRSVNVFPVVFVRGRFVTIPADEVLRDRSVERDLYAVQVGRNISFSEDERPRKFFDSGWSVPEQWGTWSVGRRAVLRFRLDPGEAHPSYLILNCGAFVTPKLPQQRATVQMNGRELAQFTFSLDEDGGAPKEIAVPIPANFWDKRLDHVEIEFQTPDARSPADLGDSADPRVLALRMVSLEFSNHPRQIKTGTQLDGHIDVSHSSAMRSIDIADLVSLDAAQRNVLLLLDSSWPYDIWPAVRGLKKSGVAVVSVIYDLIPLTHSHTCVPELIGAFRAWMQGQVKNADAVVGISRYVADTVEQYFKGFGVTREIPVTWFHLGAELNFAAPLIGPSGQVKAIVGSATDTFLMVGTIEPRKNHRQVFNAFDRAWRLGFQAQLVIVGSYAWKTEQLIAEIQGHPEFGKRLHLVRGATDADVDYLYRNAIALIIASEVEGFGLPIVEARQRGLPVIASDIQVFREIADSATLFFALGDTDSLFECMQQVVSRGKSSFQTASGRWMTWRESTEELLTRIEELLERCPASVNEDYRSPRISRLLLRLQAWSRRSRVVLSGEDAVPQDPYAPAYLLLAVQAKRISLGSLVGELHSGSMGRWPKIAFCILLRYLDLRISVALANALLTEQSLMRLNEQSQRFRSNETRGRKT